mgnify:CR=1 FL=1
MGEEGDLFQRPGIADDDSSAISAVISSMALPMPTIAGTFSVPARRLRSCAPPSMRFSMRTPVRM